MIRALSSHRSAQVALANLETFFDDKYEVRTDQSARHHWGSEVCTRTMYEVYIQIKKETVSFEHVRENFENLYAMVEYLDVETPMAAQVRNGSECSLRTNLKTSAHSGTYAVACTAFRLPGADDEDFWERRAAP